MKKFIGVLLLVLIVFSSCDLFDAIMDRISQILIIPMVYVEGGTFQMGDDEQDDNPEHSVTLSDFSIGKYEITHAEYIRFLNGMEVPASGMYNGVELVDTTFYVTAIAHNGSEFVFDSSAYLISTEDSPINKISWYAAVYFCNWLSENNALDQVYTITGMYVEADFTKNGYRLPTDAEWEFAARGGNESQGYFYSGSDSIDDVAWYSPNSDEKIHPVGQKEPNELGIYDMSGNVNEWCWDYYDPYYTDSTIVDPLGPLTENYDYYVTLNGIERRMEGTYELRVRRGGDYYDYNDVYCQVADRSKSNPVNTPSSQGFRIARSMR